MNDFKVGDWVRIGDTVQQVIEVNPENNYNITADMIETTDDYVSVDSVTKWQPQEGEWCWFSEENSFSTIGQYSDSTPDGKHYMKSHPLDLWDSVEPFIGELPSFVKDR